MILNKILEDFERSDQKKGVLFEQKSHKSDKSNIFLNTNYHAPSLLA